VLPIAIAATPDIAPIHSFRDTSFVVAGYQAPSPPPNSGPHRYQTIVLEQPCRVSVKRIVDRWNFDLSYFMSQYGMREVARTVFLTENE